MNSAAFATGLLGATVRLLERPPEAAGDIGEIVTIYIDARGLHYVALVHGRLIEVDASQFRVVRA